MKEARHTRPHIVWSRLCEMSRIGKSIETEGREVIARGQGYGGMEGWGVITKGMGFLFEKMKIF